jgi:Raf kinase inhibitor-like YbhB/YbcL family protein
MRSRVIRRLLAGALFFAAANGFRESHGGAAMSFRLSSSSFEHEKSIPAKHTCEGSDVSPPLAWSNVPGGTKSLALIVDDPDAPDPRAPQRTWVHWVIYAISPTLTALPEEANATQFGIREGLNDWHSRGYRGPCPPIGRHRYFHKLYALDTILPELDPPDKATLERAMRGHVLGQATLIGTYAKTGQK